MIAGSRVGVSRDTPAPEASMWEPVFEGQDARQVRLSLPYMAVQDHSGQVYIADKLAHGVRRVDEILEIYTAAGTGQSGDGSDHLMSGPDCGLSFPNALWVHPTGGLYILDFGNAKVRRLNARGEIETLFELPKGLKGGRGLVVEPNEQIIYVAAKDRIYRYLGHGKLEVFARGFENLGHLVLGANNELYAADRDAGYVYQIGKAGEKKIVAGDGTMQLKPNPAMATRQGLNQPRALAWVPDFGLLVGTQGGRRVYRLTPSGTLELLLDGSGEHKEPQALRINAPLGKLRGLFVAPNGDLLLTHGDIGQVLRFKKSRNAT